MSTEPIYRCNGCQRMGSVSALSLHLTEPYNGCQELTREGPLFEEVKPLATAPVRALEDKLEESVQEVLGEMLERVEHFSQAIVIAKKKDGTHYLRTSNMSNLERAGLFCFFQAYINELYSEGGK